MSGGHRVRSFAIALGLATAACGSSRAAPPSGPKVDPNESATKAAPSPSSSASVASKSTEPACPASLPSGFCPKGAHCRYDDGDRFVENDADARVDCYCALHTKDPSTLFYWACLER